jgi:hypothetical protein
MKHWYYSFKLNNGAEIINPEGESYDTLYEVVMGAISHVLFSCLVPNQDRYTINIYDYPPVNGKFGQAIHIYEFNTLK